MFKYCLEQWDPINEKWFEIGGSTSKYVAMTNIYELKKKNLNIFYRIVMVIDIR